MFYIRYDVILYEDTIVGNNDMHLKNLSLYAPKCKSFLTPAYDLLNVSMVYPKDTEELALTLNGRKKLMKKSDFVSAMTLSGIAPNVFDNMLEKYRKLLPKFYDMIDMLFLDDESKEIYKQGITSRSERMSAQK